MLGPARNAPCTCGSGRRLKHCCGDAQRVPATIEGTMRRALELQQAGALDRAAPLYEDALARSPGLPDALHMLGVVHLQRGNCEQALPLLHEAARAFAWRLPAVRHNLGLAVAGLLATRNQESLDDLRARYAAFCDARAERAREGGASISVVVPSYNHAAFIGEALASLRHQTRLPDEVVVVDDGSTDSSCERIRDALANWPGRATFKARGNRGAAATINEAVAASSGEFVNVLNSDDRFAPTRLASMATAVAGSGASFGFARTRVIGDAGERDAEVAYLVDGAAARDTAGMALVAGNAAVSSGNLFFSRALFERLGGFADFRYNHDWDFALRASLLTEPVLVPRDEYEYRVHGANTIDESRAAAEAEMAAVFTRFYDVALATRAPANPFAPVPAVWGTRFFECVLAAGHASLLPIAVLEQCIAQAREGEP